MRNLLKFYFREIGSKQFKRWEREETRRSSKLHNMGATIENEKLKWADPVDLEVMKDLVKQTIAIGLMSDDERGVRKLLDDFMGLASVVG